LIDTLTAERDRLKKAETQEEHWRRWGTYVSDRAWGTVREDYSPNGTAWDYFPFEHAHLRAFRWSEDALLGWCDNHQRLCFGIALWNGKDRILKERLYGLSGPQGNHSEDVKEIYYYLDATPTHSYCKALYKYPQAEFPYAQLTAENRRRSRADPEYELIDTGVFDQDRYFDITVEYAKASVDDTRIRISAVNRGPGAAKLWLLPSLWFRNTWTWGRLKDLPPSLAAAGDDSVLLRDPTLGEYLFSCPGAKTLLFTENEGNSQRLWGVPNRSFTKDAFAQYLIEGNAAAVNPARKGTKACGLYEWELQPGEERSITLRLAPRIADSTEPDASVFTARIAEAEAFYDAVPSVPLSDDGTAVCRQAFAGLLWTKQFYSYVVEDWLQGDPNTPPPPPGRRHVRNADWPHLFNSDIISMPDKWEYPWYAAWDLAFHMVPLAMIDADFAKRQMALFLREWYMHPNGQIPAYEWALGDVNPPVHAWACWRIYQIDRRLNGAADYGFLERCFHKLLMNFTWWVNRKDTLGNNVFEGGFLGLDNIGVFDRSAPLPTGGTIEQSDGTSWMAMYSLNMLTIALELAQRNDSYEDIASKFFEHFLYIASAANGRTTESLWDEEDGFYYDLLRLPSGEWFRMKVRSMVGIIPLFAMETIEPAVIDKLPGFRRRMQWFLRNRPDLCRNLASMTERGMGERRMLSLVGPNRLRRILQRVLDENEFLSPHGIRALSRYHAANPYSLKLDGAKYEVCYEPAESSTGLFGGNSNWRGPIWFPVNYLLIESLQRFHHYLGEDFKVEFPTGSGNRLDLWEVAGELSQRISSLYIRGADGRRPGLGPHPKFQQDPHFRDHMLFYEYFHGDTGAGLGANHQTGWTALIAKLLTQNGE